MENYLIKRHIKLLSLLKLTGEIEGRKKFQKIVYILQSLGIDFNFSYKYHYYGPYSIDLQLTLEDLKAINLLKEERVEYSEAYNYSLIPEILEDSKLDSELANKLDLISFLNKQDSNNLELVATIYYLRKNGYENEKALKGKLTILKPHLKNKIDKAFDMFNKIDKNNFH
jgi:uncharacterized protein